MTTTRKRIDHPGIRRIYTIDMDGIIYDQHGDTIKPYNSSNGYDYCTLLSDTQNIFTDPLVIYELGYIVAKTFIPIPDELANEKIIVCHINGNNRDNRVSNLKWVIDVELWSDFQIDDIITTGYSVSNWGRIKSPRGLLLNLTNGFGYKFITLRLESTYKRRKLCVHQIVARSFINNNNPERIYVNHINGNTSDNHYMNLEFVTPGENHAHAIHMGLTSRFATVSNVMIAERLLIQYEGSIKKVVDHLINEGCNNVSETVIQRIKNNMKFTGYEFSINHIVKLTPEMLTYVEKILDENNGSIVKTLAIAKTVYPELTYSNVDSIKIKLKKMGRVYVDGARNRKITEQQRAQLIELIREHQSVSTVYNMIRNDSYFENVTVYDLKYLKRKYVTC